SAYRIQLFTCFAKSSFPLLIRPDRFEKVFLPEIRPEGRRDIEFSISNLPQQEIAYPHFSACSDQQLWVWDARRLQIVFKNPVVNIFFINFATFYIPGKRPCGLHDLPSAAVA